MDLSPGYRELAPPPAPDGALACLWVQVVAPAGDAPPTRVLPDACSDLVWISGLGAFVAGPDTGPVLATLSPGAILVGARFAPGAGGEALGLPLSELRDIRVDVADLRPELAARLPADLAPAHALTELVDIASGLAAPPDPLVGAAAQVLADPRVRVAGLAPALGLSERQLRRRCHDAVGYGPKTLQRVLRFRSFLAKSDAAGPAGDLARLAAGAGYADQAHLTHDCARLSGLSPAALVRARATARRPAG